MYLYAQFFFVIRKDLRYYLLAECTTRRIPRWLSCIESACHAGDAGLIPGSETSPGEGDGNPLQYSCLGNPKGREAWWAIVHVVTEEPDMM